MRNHPLRVGLIGVGNCASSFVQGLEYYKPEATANEPQPGLMHLEIGGYRVSDITVSAAFDISAAKVGRPLADAIAAEPNNTIRFSSATGGVRVLRGPTLDGLGQYMSDVIESEEPVADVAQALRNSKTDVLVSYLPVGSQQATEWYAERALEAGCAFVNCIPVFIAAQRNGGSASRRKGCPSLATTSRVRWEPQSSTAC